MAVERCPECGRAWDGSMCLACGHEAGTPTSAASETATKTVAPKEEEPSASLMNSLPATQNPFATGATATGAVNPFANTGVTNPLTASPGSPRPVTGLYTGPASGEPATKAPHAKETLGRVPKTPPTPPPRTEAFMRPGTGGPVVEKPKRTGNTDRKLLAPEPTPERPAQPHISVKKKKTKPARTPTPAAKPASQSSAGPERCPDCGRVTVAGACLACGWRDPSAAQPTPPARTATPAAGAPSSGMFDIGADSDLAGNYPARSDVGGEAPSDVDSASDAAAGGFKIDPQDHDAPMDGAVALDRPAISPEKKRIGMVAAFAGVFIVALIVALVFMPDAGSVDDATHQDAVDARATLASLKSVPNDRRTGEQWLDVAHAHASLGESEPALTAYTRASKLSVMDEAGTRYCIAQLADPLMRDIAVRVLTDFPQGTNVDALLKEVLDHDAIVMRNNALRVLKRRGTDTVDMHVDVAIADLTRGPTCSDRRNGIKRLGDYASGAAKRRTLDAIRTVEDHIGTELNSCMIVEIDKIKARIIDR